MVTGTVNMTSSVLGGTPTAVPTAHKEPTAVKNDRRSNKPIMEKRRRARINNCLNELKALILDATKKDPARHSKLEKADILEKTVKHLQELQRQQAIMQQASDPKIINKFKAGFADCANEVSRFPGLEPAVKRRLLHHLSNCINGVKAELQQQQQHHRQAQAQAQAQSQAQQQQQLHAQMLPSPPSSPEQDQQHLQQAEHNNNNNHNMNSTFIANGGQIQQTVHGFFLPNGWQVYPTKLPNGSIALVLPQSLPQHQHQQHQQHHLLQSLPQQAAAAATAAAALAGVLQSMPTRTASTASASSHSSASGYERALISPSGQNVHAYTPPSPANSYEAMDCKPSVIQHSSGLMMCNTPQQPLSLVMKKNNIVHRGDEEQPWRPW